MLLSKQLFVAILISLVGTSLLTHMMSISGLNRIKSDGSMAFTTDDIRRVSI